MAATTVVAAGSSWKLREEGLLEICGLLEHQISPPSTLNKSQILQQLHHYSQFPDFNNYLVFILSHADVCEDIPQVLDSGVPGMNERPINLFLPRFFKFFQSPYPMLRKLALNSVNQYIMLMHAFLYKSMDQYLKGLFMLANDTTTEVRKLIVETLRGSKLYTDKMLMYVENHN